MRLLISFAISVILTGGAVRADDVALVIGSRDYAYGPDIREGEDILRMVAGLEAAGFRVFSERNAGGKDMREVGADFNAAADGSGRIVIALSGQFAMSEEDIWFLGVDANKPDLIEVGAAGLPLSVMMEIAARSPGQAVMLLGTERRDMEMGPGIKRGLKLPEAAQGVSVIAGPAGDVADFARDRLLQPGQNLPEALKGWRTLVKGGYLSTLVPFIADKTTPGDAPGINAGASEQALWRAAERAGTIDAYQTYLRQYPGGAYADIARARLRDAGVEPTLSPQDQEKLLRLTRARRAQIQSDLSALGYNTRGVDGIFGRGTRNAITNWQRENELKPTGYLTQEAIDQLSAQVKQRRREEKENERAYWENTGAQGDEDGLRAYLERYPEGEFAAIAKERLTPFDIARDRRDWDDADKFDTIQAYETYLDAHPEGEYADEARTRIADLEFGRLNRDDLRRAEREEQALKLSRDRRELVEERLADLGLDPGKIDGKFDRDTRRAIRQYQSARNLPATGYLTQTTLVRLVADSIFNR